MTKKKLVSGVSGSNPAFLPTDPGPLRSHVAALCGCSPRHATAPGLDRAADYVRSQLALAGRPVEEQTFDRNGKTFRNFVVSFGPSDGKRVVVGAHYDGRDDTPGADDNASGVAVLLELAKHFSSVPLRTRLDLAAYTLEEINPGLPALQGSTEHARKLRQEKVQVKLMIALEMLGYFDDRPGQQKYPFPLMKWFYPAEGHYLAVVGSFHELPWVIRLVRRLRKSSPLMFYGLAAPQWVPGIEHSDHQSFWNRGYPAVMVTDTAYLRNPHYHRPTDTPDTLDYIRMAHATDALRAVLTSIVGK
jgi:hypothetical protein